MAREMPGTTFDFHVVSGEVLGTDQRSDSVTTGSSRTVVYQGTGSGSGHVSTEVVVNRDIWFRMANGQERHVRFQADIPVRVGQHVAFVYLKAKRTEARKVDELFSVYTLSTNRYQALRGFDAIATALVEPEYTPNQANLLALARLAACASCLIGVGIPILLGWHRYNMFATNKRKSMATEIAAAMKREHDTVLHAVHRTFEAEQKRLATVAAERPLGIGATS